MPRKWAFAVVLALCGVLGGISLPATAAAAIEDCDEKVVDGTFDQVLGNRAELNAAIQRLENLGLDVRVQAFDVAPGGSIEAYTEVQVENCATWRGDGGFMKPNLLVFTVTLTDQRSGIQYGSTLKRAMDPVMNDLRIEEMYPSFEQGDFVTGIVNAMKATEGVIENRHSSDSSTSIGDSAAGLIFVWLLVGIAGLVALVIAGVALARVRRRRKEHALATARMQQKAIAVRQEAIAELGKINEEDAERSVELILSDLNADDTSTVNAAWQQANEAVIAAYAANGEMSDAGVEYDPERTYDLEQYTLIHDMWNEVKTLAVTANAKIREVEELCAELHEEMEEAPTALEQLRDRLAKAIRQRQQLVGEGFHISDYVELAQADTQLAMAEEFISQRRFGHAIGHLNMASGMIDKVEQDMVRLLRTKNELERTSTEFTSALEELGAGRDDAERALGEMQERFDPNCWTEARDILEVAIPRAREAQGHLESATSNMSMEVQDWDTARDQLTAAKAAIDDAGSAYYSVTEQLEKLEQLDSGAANRIAGLREQLKSAKSKVKHMRGSQSGSVQKLKDLAKDIDTLAQAVQQTQPDCFANENKAQRIENAIAEVLKDAKKIQRRYDDDQPKPTYGSTSTDSAVLGGFIAGNLLGGISGGSPGGGTIGGWGGGSPGGGSVGGWGG